MQDDITIKVHNVTIIGSGPSALTAAIYSGRAELKPLLIEGSENPGGQLITTDEIENYPGYSSILGFDLVENMRNQALKYSTTIVPKTVTKVNFRTFPFELYLDDEIEPLKTKAVIIATGSSAKRLAPSVEAGLKSISACAVCDAALYKNKRVFVIGGGDSSLTDALFITRFTNDVTIIHRGDKFRASKIMQNRVFNNNNIKIIWNSEVMQCCGEKKLQSVELKNNKTGDIWSEPCNALFIAIGHKPSTDFLLNSGLELDNDGYIITQPDTSLTSIPGVFACGDVQDKKYKQAITACGSGCQSALDCEAYLTSLDDLSN